MKSFELIEHLKENRKEITEKCTGCKKIDGDVCGIYYNPDRIWKIGMCPIATHVERKLKNTEFQRVGQQKQKKSGKKKK